MNQNPVRTESPWSSVWFCFVDRSVEGLLQVKQPLVHICTQMLLSQEGPEQAESVSGLEEEEGGPERPHQGSILGAAPPPAGRIQQTSPKFKKRGYSDVHLHSSPEGGGNGPTCAQPP